MRYARRLIAILVGFAAAFIATATVAYAALAAKHPAVAPFDPQEMPGSYNHFPGGEAARPSTLSTSVAGLPLWQFLAFVALVVLTAVAIVA